jgi:hypothetical protein
MVRSRATTEVVIGACEVKRLAFRRGRGIRIVWSCAKARNGAKGQVGLRAESRWQGSEGKWWLGAEGKWWLGAEGKWWLGAESGWWLGAGRDWRTL